MSARLVTKIYPKDTQVIILNLLLNHTSVSTHAFIVDLIKGSLNSQSCSITETADAGERCFQQKTQPSVNPFPELICDRA